MLMANEQLTPAEYLLQRHPKLAPTSPVSYLVDEYTLLRVATALVYSKGHRCH